MGGREVPSRRGGAVLLCVGKFVFSYLDWGRREGEGELPVCACSSGDGTRPAARGRKGGTPGRAACWWRYARIGEREGGEERRGVFSGGPPVVPSRWEGRGKAGRGEGALTEIKELLWCGREGWPPPTELWTQ